MSFLKDFKDDLSQAVNELVTEDGDKETTKAKSEPEAEDVSDSDMVNTLDEDVLAGLDLDTISDLLEDTEEEEVNEEPEADLTEETAIEEDEKEEAPIPKKPQPEKKAELKEPAASSEDEDDIPSDEVAEITKGTSITGNIMSDGSINVYGKIIGDVTCKGKMVITGMVQGTSMASEIFANNAKIEGDVKSSGSIKIGNGSIIMGNVYATSAVIGGAVRGDIDVHGPVIVDATAVVQGNIKSRSVQINNGAAIEGFCSQCYADIDYKALFDDTFGKN